MARGAAIINKDYVPVADEIIAADEELCGLFYAHFADQLQRALPDVDPPRWAIRLLFRWRLQAIK